MMTAFRRMVPVRDEGMEDSVMIHSWTGLYTEVTELETSDTDDAGQVISIPHH